MTADINEIWSDDTLSRKQSALFLYNYLVKNQHIKVLNVNSPWGTGKTFFLERWSNQLRNDHICVSFNAWKNDFSVEPLISLASAIDEQLRENNKNENLNSKLTNFISKTAKVIKASSPVIAKGALQKLIGFNSDDLSEVVKDSLEVAADASEKAIEALINNQRAAEKNTEDFKVALTSVFDQYKKNKRSELQDDVFIIIDELDRCRPTYAIELLERIKHFFDMENCRFIIASDTEQLAHSVRAVYGEGFDSQRYLKRFFDAEFSLDNSRVHEFIAVRLLDFPRTLTDAPALTSTTAIEQIKRSPFYNEKHIPEPDPDTILFESDYDLEVLYLTALSKFFRTSLREIDKNIKQLRAIHDNAPNGFQFLYAAFLIFLKDANPEAYKTATTSTNKVQYNEILHPGKMPDQNILFISRKMSALDIFINYQTRINKQRSELRQDLNSEDEVIAFIARSVFNYHEKLKQYPRLVDLASSLK